MSPGWRGGLIHWPIVAPLGRDKAAHIAPYLGAPHGLIAAYYLGLYVIPLFFNQVLRVLQK